MFIFRPPEEDHQLEAAIAHVYEQLTEVNQDSKEKAELLGQLSKLYSLRKEPKRISPDTIAIVLGNLLGILIIISHERTHVVTTKALGFIMKPR